MTLSYVADLAYTHRVVVDDTDSRISYDAGTWDLDISSFDSYGRWGDPYNKTLKGTKSQVASFTFTFEGKYISVKGAKENSKINRPANASSDSLDLLPKWTCELDGTPAIETRQYDLGIRDTTDIRLCEGSDLTPGRHTLKVNVNVTDPNTQVFWLDSIEYAPLDGVSWPVNEVVRVDSSDPVSCSYHNSTGQWKDDNYGNYTKASGANMSFKFNGTSVSLYGILWPANPSGRFVQDSTNGSYSIDNAESIPFTIPAAKPFPSDPTGNDIDWWNQLLFKTSPVEGGREHEILITYTGASNGQKPPQLFDIDYFHVVNDRVLGNGSTSPELTGKEKTPVGAIVGGVMGGVLILIVIIGMSWYLLKRRRRRRENEVSVYPGIVTAFTKTAEDRWLSAVPSTQREVIDVEHREQDSGIRYSTTTLPPIYTAE